MPVLCEGYEKTRRGIKESSSKNRKRANGKSTAKKRKGGEAFKNRKGGQTSSFSLSELIKLARDSLRGQRECQEATGLYLELLEEAYLDRLEKSEKEPQRYVLFAENASKIFLEFGFPELAKSFYKKAKAKFDFETVTEENSILFRGMILLENKFGSKKTVKDLENKLFAFDEEEIEGFSKRRQRNKH